MSRLKLFVGILMTVICSHPLFAQFKFEITNEYTFQSNGTILEMPWVGGINSAQYQTMDLNGDGLQDLVIFDRTSFKLNTFINVDNQDYVYDKDYEYTFPEDISNWIILADYNCDGKKDIFTNSPFGIRVYKNIGDNLPEWELVADPLFTQGFSSQVNLQVNDADIPAITDIDGDGDIDILAFNFFSADRIDYHQNMSMEQDGNCEEMDFVRVDRHWGKVEECDCGEFAFDAPCSEGSDGGSESSRVQHVGGKTLLAFDNDGDGDKDLLFGDEDCEALIFFENVGDAQNALFTSFSDQYPNSSDAISIRFFPAAYYEDVTFDGVKDLLVSPNTYNNAGDLMDFRSSSLLYVNQGSNDNPEFEFVQNDFLQDQMLDLGDNALPLFMDVDADGDQDLLLTSRGQLQNDGFYGTVWLLEQKTSGNTINFELVDENYLNFALLRFKNLQLFLADVNQDGKDDLLFTGSDQSAIISKDIFYIINTASTEGAYAFNVTDMQQFPFSIIFNEFPYFHDINQDGFVDILLGKATGRIEYYINDGTNNFSLETNQFYGITDDTFKRNPSIQIKDLNGDELDELIVSDATGNISIYDDYLNHLNEPQAGFQNVIQNDLANNLFPAKFGRQSWFSFADLDGNRLPEMFVGGFQGGGQFYKNASDRIFPGGPDDNLQLLVYPNPTITNRYVQIESNANVSISIFNTLGQRLKDTFQISASEIVSIDVTTFPNGVYIVAAEGPNGKTSQKIIINK